MFVRPNLSILFLTALAAAACGQSSGVAVYVPETNLEGVCLTPLAPHEPLCSQAFGDSVWPASHRGSYAQGSSPFAGPTEASSATSAHIALSGAGVPVILTFTAPYEDGGRAAWATVTSLDNAVIKLDHESFEIIDNYVPGVREENPPKFELGVTGAYDGGTITEQVEAARDSLIRARELL
jgi:hypothetical protein